MAGTPPVRALFFEFPTEPELFGNDKQFLIGRDILVTPVLIPNVTSVEGSKMITTLDFTNDPYYHPQVCFQAVEK